MKSYHRINDFVSLPKGSLFIFRVLIIVLVPLFSVEPQWPSSVEEELIIGGGRYPQAVSDGDGGVIVCWQWFGEPGGIYMQRVDKYGYKCFPEPIHIQGLHDSETLMDHKIVTDGKGGVYVLFQDIIFWDYPNIQNRHLRLHHIDSSGTFLWGKGGILIATPVDTTIRCYHDPTGSCIYDGEGGLIVAWQDYRYTDRYLPYGHVFIQKYKSDGKSLWDSGGVQLTDSLIICPYPKLCTDGDGGAYVYYEKLQRVDRYGRKRWGSGIKFSDSGVHNLNYDLQEGVYCVGFYYPNYPESYLYCLRVDSSGTPIWNQRVFLDTIYSGKFPYRILSVTNADSSISIVTPDNRLFRISPDGEMIYGNEGILVDTVGVVQSLLSDKDGSNIVLWVSHGIKASKFDRYGRPCWENQPLLITKQRMNNVGDAIINDDGSIIVAMEITIGYITVKRITSDGKIGGDDVGIVENKESNHIRYFQLYGICPNPFNEATVISYELYRKEKVELSIYNIEGKEVAKLVNKEHVPGYYKVRWNGRNKSGEKVPSGIYIAVLKVAEYKKSFKITLLR
ncbi:MAG: hypothetical protein DRP91_07615 [Candidatus Neomarinimicrobiota bacterium]|nr:T9SS type A sorting domain-containing protein [Candidatus Neomarinimicrobiota bacterium]RKY47412.1 MAG: hypothetical protein DRP91_07615 [Candidatus Neomarinimicrobiota bacterium]RKY53364.1 MAG: hypothetical protein DRP92_03635 [Candidatus Neomarinimicrobiota bacterium]